MSRTLQRSIEVLLIVLLFLPAIFITIVMAGIIMFKDGYSPIFHQQRVGRGGVMFRCYKLQTMRPKLPHEQYHDPEDDARRVTSFGAFLREYGIDELPQFINIARREMTLFGPRPMAQGCIQKVYDHRCQDEAKFWDTERQTFLPGISGWHQVHTSDVFVLKYDNEFAAGLTMRQFVQMVLLSLEVLPAGKRTLHHSDSV